MAPISCRTTRSAIRLQRLSLRQTEQRAKHATFTMKQSLRGRNGVAGSTRAFAAGPSTGIGYWLKATPHNQAIAGPECRSSNDRRWRITFGEVRCFPTRGVNVHPRDPARLQALARRNYPGGEVAADVNTGTRRTESPDGEPKPVGFAVGLLRYHPEPRGRIVPVTSTTTR